jgi:hypothetical protein
MFLEKIDRLSKKMMALTRAIICIKQGNYTVVEYLKNRLKSDETGVQILRPSGVRARQALDSYFSDKLLEIVPLGFV